VVVRRAPRFIELLIDGLTGNHLSLMLLPVENGEGQGMAFVENGDLALCVLTNGDLGLSQSIGRARSDDLVDDLLVLESQVLGEDAVFLPGEDAVEIVGG
jgi:hypothetical protein